MPLTLRLALRDLRGGLRGFAIFLACIALGVAAITGVGSVSRALSDGLAGQGRTILGGDVVFDLVQRAASEPELDFFRAHGRLARVSTLRAMARSADMSGAAVSTALVELKAVGADYPTEGRLALDPPLPVGHALAEVDGAFGAAADAALGARLGLKVGDAFRIGQALFQLRTVLVQEPDKLAAGINIGPRVLISEAALAATGLVQPGSLVRRLYRVSLPAAAPGRPAPAADVHALVRAAAARFPEAGWEVRTRENVSPQFARDLDRFTQFLTLVGLTALIVGGAGVANAVRAFVERKRPVIATMKSLGATGGGVFALMLIEVVLIAALGVAGGLAVGIALPFVVSWAFAAVLPLPLAPSVYPAQVGAGLLYGLLTALAFSLAPLGRAHDTPVSALFRDRVEPSRQSLRPRYVVLASLAGIGLAAAAVLLANQRSLALYYIGATACGFAVLRLVAGLVTLAARRAPRSRRFSLRLAVANIHRPGALTPSVVLSLGLGLGLLVCLALIDGNIRAQLRQALPGQTPSFFFVDVQSADAPAFRDFLQQHAPDGALEFVPMMRGRISRVNGTPVADVKPGEKAAWVLQGDRGITFSDEVPAGSKLVRGTWWPQGYAGPPLVSLEADIADGLGLKLGDTVSVNVFGREVTAKIANTRKVDWRKLGINFVLVFSPDTFAGAPYGDLATVTFPDKGGAAAGGRDGRELTLLREVAQAYPGITTVRVRDALDAVAVVVGQLATAIRGAAAVALVSSVLVLAGALAAGQEARIYDAVVLKTLGATRGRLLAAFLLEYGIVGAAAAVFGVVAGSLAAYLVVAKVMTLDFTFFWQQALVAAVGALVLTVLLGLAGTWRVLGRKPARTLRSQ